MNKARIKYLVDRFLDGSATLSEQAELADWLELADDSGKFSEILKQAWIEYKAPESIRTIADPVLTRIEVRLSAHTQALRSVTDPVRLTPAARVRRISFLKNAWIRYAAVLLLLVGAAAYLYNTGQSSADIVRKNPSPRPSVMQPGGNRAMLILSDGRTIMLDTAAIGKLAGQGNTSVMKISAGELAYTGKAPEGKSRYNTVSTPKGGQYQVRLPDGSKVWLNAASSLRFPLAFEEGAREVELTGEAFFEIVPRASSPFEVKMGESRVKVLGTSFNVNAYDDERYVRTTLLEGSVQVLNGKETKVLQPGEQAVTAAGGAKAAVWKIKLEAVEMEQATAWKDGFFYFERADIQTIMRQLSRWYNAEIRYEGKVTERFVARISRNQPLSEVLRKFEQTGLVHFDINKNIITVKP